MATARPYCLTIAGLDPSGGAGIVADCKTFEQLKVQGLSVVTANTIQTEDRFLSREWVPEATILLQLETLLERYPVRFFKIGLIENADVLLKVLETIHRYVSQPFIVWDPILAPTAGGNLSEQRFSPHLQDILSKVRFITPNIPEYQTLFGDTDAAENASERLFIYLKGGHASNPGTDKLYAGKKIHPFRAHVQTTLTKHGTGCVLSAAIVAHLSREFPLVKACLRSKRYLEKVLVSNETLLGYHKL